MKTAHDLVTLAKARTQEVARDAAGAAIQGADVLLDVREAQEYAAGHLPLAIHASRGTTYTNPGKWQHWFNIAIRHMPKTQAAQKCCCFRGVGPTQALRRTAGELPLCGCHSIAKQKKWALYRVVKYRPCEDCDGAVNQEGDNALAIQLCAPVRSHQVIRGLVHEVQAIRDCR
ncbi:MAG: rhodanese-like domain-containing protein [Betaproteobacteria bacterium]